MMRYKYKVGHIYTNGEHVGQNRTLRKGEFTVNQNIPTTLHTLSSYMSIEEATNIIDYQGINKYLLRQFSHVEEQDTCTLIIPCYTIANRFYLISSSMKHAIMTEKLDELYYEGSVHKEIIENEKDDPKIRVNIDIKKKAGKKDLPFLCRFLTNPLSKSRLEYVANQKSLSTFELQPIKALLPIREPFNIFASYIYIGDDERGLPKYLVLNIHSDNSPLGFDELHYRQYSATKNPNDIDPEKYYLPRKSKKTVKREQPQRTNTIYTGTPSNEYVTYTLRSHEDEYYKHNVSMYGQTLYMENESNLKVEKSDKTVGNSFKKATAGGDKNLGEMRVSDDSAEGDSKPKEMFNLQNFHQFYEALLFYSGVRGSELYGPFEIHKIQNKVRKSLNTKSICHRDTNIPRKFLFGELNYDQKSVYIVEIEQDPSWAPSTWIFYTDEDTKQYDEHDMQAIIEYYIENSLLYKDLEEYVLKTYSLIFHQKEHKKGYIDDDSIERWCESILKKSVIL